MEGEETRRQREGNAPSPFAVNGGYAGVVWQREGGVGKFEILVRTFAPGLRRKRLRMV